MASRIRVAVGVGTGAHRVSAYNPLTVFQRLLDGRTVGGARTECRLSRLVALESLLTMVGGRVVYAAGSLRELQNIRCFGVTM